MKNFFKLSIISIMCLSLLGCSTKDFYRAYIQSGQDYYAAYEESPRTEFEFDENGRLKSVAIRDPMQRTMMPKTFGQKLLDYALPLGLGLGSMYFTYLNNKEAFNFASGAFTFGSDISAQSFANEPFVVQP